MVSEKDTKAVATLMEALKLLPTNKQEFLLGYAEGVMAMAESAKVSTPPNVSPPLNIRTA